VTVGWGQRVVCVGFGFFSDETAVQSPAYPVALVSIHFDRGNEMSFPRQRRLLFGPRKLSSSLADFVQPGTIIKPFFGIHT